MYTAAQLGLTEEQFKRFYSYVEAGDEAGGAHFYLEIRGLNIGSAVETYRIVRKQYENRRNIRVTCWGFTRVMSRFLDRLKPSKKKQDECFRTLHYK